MTVELHFRSWLMKRIFALLITLLPMSAWSIVDMRNANYAESWLDITVPGTGFDLKVQRYYNSRSNFNGMFGFGWCSDFETALSITPEGNLKYQECGAGQEIKYSKGRGDDKETLETVEKILAHVRKTNRSASTQYLERLRSQLINNAEVRTRWAQQAGLETPELKKGTVYSADNLEVEKITWNGENFVRNLADGTQQKFDNNGRLVVLSDKNNNFIRLVWRDGLLREVVDNNGRKLSFQHEKKRVSEIKGPSGLKAEYKYTGEDLTWMKNMWRNVYTFSYENHNLVRINFPDKTFKALTYDQKRDLVTSFTDRAQNNVTCVENYTYEESKDDPKNHFWSTATKRCGKEVKNQARFEFWHKTLPNGEKYLHRVLTKTNAETLDVTYHPEFSRPISIRKNGSTTTFSYFPNGLVRERSTPNLKLTYEYKNQFNKVSKVTSEYFDDKLKPLRKRETTFQYDKKGNLSFAQNSDGQTVRLTYDSRGRIASITDQAKKEVQIKYDERSNKPAVITRPNVGSIVVTYKENNEVKSVESKDGGPLVAVQITTTFNNLLDVIAPATSELSL